MAAWALGQLEDTQAIAPLGKAMGDESPLVRRRAAWALGEIEDGAGVDVVVPALKEHDPDVRQMAAWALGQIEDSTAVRGLTLLLKDPDTDVRVVAAWPLARSRAGRRCPHSRPPRMIVRRRCGAPCSGLSDKIDDALR